jgi:lysylphosphatidylglycerol synthetase-like protein (DUF2156 family)
VLVGAIGVVVLLAVLLCAPPLYSALQHSLDSATAILLAVPALFLGLLAGRKENQMLLELFRPLRLSAAILAAILLLLALLLVIGAGVELSRVFLIPCLIIAVAIFSLSFGGYFDLTVSAKR